MHEHPLTKGELNGYMNVDLNMLNRKKIIYFWLEFHQRV